MICCRICRRDGLKDFFSLNYQSDFYSQTGETVLEMLNFIAGLNVKLGDKLPQQLCRVCTGTLVAGYELIKLCVESDTFFRQSILTEGQKQSEQPDHNDDESFLIKLEVEVEDTENDIVEKDVNYTVEESVDRFYCCFPNCSVNYQLEEILMEHAELDHEREKEKNINNCIDTDFRCTVCARPFVEEVDLLQHRKQVTLQSDSNVLLDKAVPNSNNKVCICGFKTNRTFSLKRHQAKCFQKKPQFKLPRRYSSSLENIPDPDKTNEEVIAMGFSYHRNTTMFYCCIAECATVFETNQELCDHVQHLHPGVRELNKQGNSEQNNLFRCQICSIGFSTEKKLIVHMEDARNPKFRCNTCRYNCLSRESAILHASVPCGAKMHRCSCGYSTPYTYAIKRHMRSLGCPIEGSFLRNYRVRPTKLNEKKTVSSEILYKCQHCDKSFYSIASLRRHSKSELSRALAKQEAKNPGKIVQGSKKKQYKCRWCQEITDDSNHLVQCMIQAEKETGEDNGYTCSNCDRRFRKYNQYLEHWKSKICIQKSWLTCKPCGVKFLTRKILVRHMTNMHHKIKPIHKSKFKPYECKDCQRQFVRAYTLNRHRKSMHSPDEDF